MTEETKTKFNDLQEKINSKYLETYLQETGRPTGKGETFLCIMHEDHNPSMFYFRESKPFVKAYCRSCRKKASIFDFVKYDEGLQTRKEQLQFLKDRYSIDIPEIENRPITKQDDPEEEEIKLQEELFQEDYSQNLDKARENPYLHKQLAMKHFTERGLTEKTINEYKLTMTMKFNDIMTGEQKKANESLSNFVGSGFIFPFIDTKGRYSYIIEEPIKRGMKIEGDNPKSKQFEKYYKPTGKGILFNERYLQEKEEGFIFVCEGIFDSLSIEEMGFKSIALLTTNQSRFHKLLEKLQPKQKTFILLLDNDTQGKKGEEDLQKLFKKMNIKCLKHSDFVKEQTEWKDSNEFLIKDKDQFKKYLDSLVKEAIKMNEEQMTPEEKATKILSSGSAMQQINPFFETIDKGTFKPISTGFQNLDSKLNGGFSMQSIVILNGGTSTGKTTMTLNLCLNLAKERPILYFTLEMSKEQILSKIYSNLAYTGGGMTISNTSILQSYDTNKMTEYQRSKLIEEIQKHDELNNFFVIFPESSNIDFIQQQILLFTEELKRQGKGIPIVVIDYLQFIQGGEREDTQNLIKRTQRILKKFAIDNETLIFLLSANSREANRQKESSIDSGRDTSDIEYTADYLLSINFTEFENNPKTDKTRKQLQKEATTNKKPLKMSLTIHKQRFGGTGEQIDFDFYGIANTFKEIDPEEDIQPERRKLNKLNDL